MSAAETTSASSSEAAATPAKDAVPVEAAVAAASAAAKPAAAEAPKAAQPAAEGPKPAAKPATADAPKPAAKPATAPAAKPAAKAAPAKDAAPPPAPARTGPSAAEVARQVRRQRAKQLVRSLLLWVGLPTLLGIVYYGVLARDEFESTVTLVMSGAGQEAESHAVILREHLLSRDMLSRLDREQGFSAHYAAAGAGFGGLSAKAGSESRYGYYRRHVDARFEKDSRVFTVRVRAFSGRDAQRLATAMLDAGASFVEAVSPSRAGAPFIVVAKPSSPNEASYPERGYGMLTVFFASLCLFGIGSLLIAAVREHAQF